MAAANLILLLLALADDTELLLDEELDDDELELELELDEECTELSNWTTMLKSSRSGNFLSPWKPTFFDFASF